jgi:hypothetical protein
MYVNIHKTGKNNVLRKRRDKRGNRNGDGSGSGGKRMKHVISHGLFGREKHSGSPFASHLFLSLIFYHKDLKMSSSNADFVGRKFVLKKEKALCKLHKKKRTMAKCQKFSPCIMQVFKKVQKNAIKSYISC